MVNIPIRQIRFHLKRQLFFCKRFGNVYRCVLSGLLLILITFHFSSRYIEDEFDQTYWVSFDEEFFFDFVVEIRLELKTFNVKKLIFFSLEIFIDFIFVDQSMKQWQWDNRDRHSVDFQSASINRGKKTRFRRFRLLTFDDYSLKKPSSSSVKDFPKPNQY